MLYVSLIMIWVWNRALPKSLSRLSNKPFIFYLIALTWKIQVRWQAKKNLMEIHYTNQYQNQYRYHSLFSKSFLFLFFYYYFPFFLLLKELFPRVQFILSLLFVFDRLSYTLFKTWNSLNFHFCLIFFSFHLFSLYSLQDCLYLTIFSSSFWVFFDFPNSSTLTHYHLAVSLYLHLNKLNRLENPYSKDLLF